MTILNKKISMDLFMYKIIMLIMCLVSTVQPIISSSSTTQHHEHIEQRNKKWLVIGILATTWFGLTISVFSLIWLANHQLNKSQLRLDGIDRSIQNLDQLIQNAKNNGQALEAGINALEAQMGSQQNLTFQQHPPS